MPEKPVVLDLTRTIHSTDHVDVVPDVGQFLESARRGSWYNFVLSDPSTVESSLEVRDVWHRVSDASLEAAFLIDASSATVETTLTVADMALDAAGGAVDFHGMSLVQSPSRLVVLTQPDEARAVSDLLESGTVDQLVHTLWVQTHLDVMRWDGSQIDFESRWWPRRSDHDGFRWRPGAMLWDGDHYRMEPLSMVLGLLPSLCGAERSRIYSSLYPDDVLEEALRGCLLLVIAKWLDGVEAPMLADVRTRATASGDRLLHAVEGLCDVDSWESLTNCRSEKDPVAKGLIEVARSEDVLVRTLSGHGDALLDSVWRMINEVERRYLQTETPERAERFGRVLPEAMSRIHHAALAARDERPFL